MPFLHVGDNSGSDLQESELVQDHTGRYQLDDDRFAASMDERTRVFIMCNPHNPVGRVWTIPELERMGEICLRRNVVICSDEIHSDLIFSGHKHTPIAAISPELAQNTITLMSPSKSFNMPGLFCSFAVIQNAKLRKEFNAARRGLVNEGNLLGFTAAEAAYRLGEDWLRELMVYLENNRDALADFIQREMPELHMLKPEGTYLAWIDCRDAEMTEKPCDFFMKRARVGLNDGSAFGKGGDGFVRLNFGCPRSTLMDALERMKRALRDPANCGMRPRRLSGCAAFTTFLAGGLILLPLLAVLGYVGLRWIGAFLIVSDRVEKSDAVVVLSGGGIDRLDKAVEVIADGEARYLILTDTDEIASNGRKVTDYLFSEATQRGITVPQIDITNHTVTSTGEEATAVRDLMEERGWQRCIVVTDPFHSRRTRFLFRKAFSGSGLEARVVPVSGSWYRSSNWFLSTDGWDTTLREWSKLLAAWLGVQ